jgi:hypothetical protein
LRNRGCEVEIVGCGEADGVTALPELGRFHGTPIPRNVKPLRSALRRADVAHIVGYRDPVGTLAARTARRLGRPFFLEPAGMHRRRLRSLAVKGIFEVALGRRIVRAFGPGEERAHRGRSRTQANRCST